MNSTASFAAPTATLEVVAQIWAQQRSGTLLIPNSGRLTMIPFSRGGVVHLQDCMHLNAHARAEDVWFHEHPTDGHSNYRAVSQMMMSRSRSVPLTLPPPDVVLTVRFLMDRLSRDLDPTLLALLRTLPSFRFQDIHDRLSPAGLADLNALIHLRLVTPPEHPIWQPASTPPPEGHPAAPSTASPEPAPASLEQNDAHRLKLAQDPRWLVAEELLMDTNIAELPHILALRASLILRDEETPVETRLPHARRIIVLANSLYPSGPALVALKQAVTTYRKLSMHHSPGVSQSREA